MYLHGLIKRSKEEPPMLLHSYHQAALKIARYRERREVSQE
jgi:hypothetical protein